MPDAYTYGRMWDPSGDSIGHVLSDVAGTMCGVILEHPDAERVLCALVDGCYWQMCSHPTLEEAVRFLGTVFHTDARPDTTPPPTDRFTNPRAETAEARVADLRAQLAELADRLLTERWAHYECHREYEVAYRACADWSKRCALLEVERDRAIREVGEWAARACALQARCESRESALRECLRLAETGECGAIAIAVEAVLGEVAP